MPSDTDKSTPTIAWNNREIPIASPFKLIYSRKDNLGQGALKRAGLRTPVVSPHGEDQRAPTSNVCSSGWILVLLKRISRLQSSSSRTGYGRRLFSSVCRSKGDVDRLLGKVMSLKKRVEQLEHQAGIRARWREQQRVESLSDEELHFLICHGCSPQELQDRVTRDVRQYTEDALRVTIILEKVD